MRVALVKLPPLRARGGGAQRPRTSEQKGSYAFTHPYVRSRGYKQKEGQGGGGDHPSQGEGCSLKPTQGRRCQALEALSVGPETQHAQPMSWYPR